LAEGEEMFDLTGKRALITGSTQGIGFALAKSLSEAGAAAFNIGLTNLVYNLYRYSILQRKGLAKG
jgi:enoyl-[acyl-carrier-protein] reductase (NADH)